MKKDKNNKFKPQTANQSQKNRDANVGTRPEKKDSSLKNIVFSWQYFDKNQIPPGQSFEEWEKQGLLSDFQEKLIHLSSMNSVTAQQGKRSILTIYGDFPTNSDFNLPQFTIPEGAKWGTIKYIGNQIARVAGFMIDNVFCIVFLDKDHKFSKMQ